MARMPKNGDILSVETIYGGQRPQPKEISKSTTLSDGVYETKQLSSQRMQQ